MATSKADEYLAKALECEKRAEQTGDNFIKQRLIEIAQSGGPWPLTKTNSRARLHQTHPSPLARSMARREIESTASAESQRGIQRATLQRFVTYVEGTPVHNWVLPIPEDGGSLADHPRKT